MQPTPEIKKLFEALAGIGTPAKKGSTRDFFRTEASARADRTCGSRLAGPCWLWKATLMARPDRSVTLSWSGGIRTPIFIATFTCFKDADSGCEVRGTAHWDGDKFVNDYEELVPGNEMRFRDTFQDITPNSHTLVFAWIKANGSTQPVIINKAVRRASTAGPG